MKKSFQKLAAVLLVVGLVGSIYFLTRPTHYKIDPNYGDTRIVPIDCCHPGPGKPCTLMCAGQTVSNIGDQRSRYMWVFLAIAVIGGGYLSVGFLKQPKPKHRKK